LLNLFIIVFITLFWLLNIINNIIASSFVVFVPQELYCGGESVASVVATFVGLSVEVSPGLHLH
jgi:hypothetical protein